MRASWAEVRGFLAVALVVISLGGGQRPLFAQESYPAWFHTMPSSDRALWAVGYARGYTELEAGMDEARSDAYERLRFARRVTVEGERLFEAVPGRRMAFRGEDFTETGRPDTLTAVSYVDSAQAGGMTLVLAVWTPDGESRPVPASLQHRIPFSKEEPPWVRSPGERGEDVRRAVGIAPRYYHLESSWRLAEERGRHRLALEAVSKLRELDRTTEDDRHLVQSVQTGVRLRRVQVLARWADEETCYVLLEGGVDQLVIR